MTPGLWVTAYESRHKLWIINNVYIESIKDKGLNSQYQVNLTFDLGKTFLITGDIIVTFKNNRPAEFVSKCSIWNVALFMIGFPFKISFLLAKKMAIFVLRTDTFYDRFPFLWPFFERS